MPCYWQHILTVNVVHIVFRQIPIQRLYVDGPTQSTCVFAATQVHVLPHKEPRQPWTHQETGKCLKSCPTGKHRNYVEILRIGVKQLYLTRGLWKIHIYWRCSGSHAGVVEPARCSHHKWSEIKLWCCHYALQAWGEPCVHVECILIDIILHTILVHYAFSYTCIPMCSLYV